MSAPAPMVPNALLEAALFYAARGWRVVPLHNIVDGRCTCQEWRDEHQAGACKMPGKHPRFLKHAKIATTDEARIRGWWRAYPDANVGISLGRESGIWALDKDPRNGGDESYDALVFQHGRLPYTSRSLTGGGGTHELWTWPADVDVPFCFDINLGLQVLGEGHILVAAPSMHPSGRRYEWEPELGPDEMLPQPAPDYLLDAIRAHVNALAAAPAPATPGKSKFPPADIGPILAGCGWLQHCSEDAATLCEPEWYSMLAVVGRCAGGDALAHEMSRAHPEYSAAATAEKLRHALAGAGPTTCAKVRHSLGGARWCDACGNWGKIKSPIVLATRLRRMPAPPLGDAPPAPAQRREGVEAEVRAAIAAGNLAGVWQLTEELAKLPAAEIAALGDELAAAFPGFSAEMFQRALGAAPPKSPSPPEDREGMGGPDLLFQPLTDSGNAQRLVALYGNQVHFCHEMDQWLLWDGKRWKPDQIGSVQQMAETMARLLYAQCASTPKDDLREAREKWARKSESAAGIGNALTRFKTQPGIPVLAGELDNHSWKLNCANGLIELKPEDGGPPRLVPHDPSLLITKLCDVPFLPEAKAPRFLEFLDRIMGGNPDAEPTQRTARLIGFLQRAFGYALTGDTSAKVVFYCYGEGGNNGKSTLLELFGDILHEYSAKINIDTLIQKPGGMSASTMDDLSALRGARLVLTSEPEEGQKLRAGLLKALASGQGTVKTKRLFERHIEFAQTHKIFLEANNLLGVPAYDNAFWDRIRAIPFTVTIPEEERDQELKDKLRAEAAGVLAWAVRGFEAIAREGLRAIPEIREQNAEWRAASDPLREFIEDRCELDPEYKTTVEAMSDAYTKWAAEFGEKYPLNRLRFNEALRKKGCRQDKDRGVRHWFGIGLRIPM